MNVWQFGLFATPAEQVQRRTQSVGATMSPYRLSIPRQQQQLVSNFQYQNVSEQELPKGLEKRCMTRGFLHGRRGQHAGIISFHDEGMEILCRLAQYMGLVSQVDG